ncbi:MAG: hypothetical protein KGI04_04795, partial [Candidatus Micrarchaeota archaeon]|nr:hypothetical protein [Candidatus Micrarchaeota archaeon]
ALTKSGMKYGGIWLLTSLLLDLKGKDASYFGGGSSQIWGENPKPVPDIASHNVAWPSMLENNLNTIRIQHETQKALAKEIISGLNRTDLSKIPANSKSVFAFEIDWSAYVVFVRDTKRFVEDVKQDIDFLTDPELEFVESIPNKLVLVESYLDNADLISDETYVKKLNMLLTDSKFVRKLLSFALWPQLLDIRTLKTVIKLFKSGKDPLKSQIHKHKLIQLAPGGKGFYVPLYDYINLSRILNHSDVSLVARLKDYERRNKIDLTNSDVFRIEQKMRPKQENK